MSAFTFETFAVGDGGEKKLTLLLFEGREEYLVPYKHFRHVFGLPNRMEGKPSGNRPKNHLTPEIMKRVREHNDDTICKPAAVRLLLLSLQDAVNLHPDSALVMELVDTFFSETIHVAAVAARGKVEVEQKKKEDSPPPPRKRAREREQVYEFEDMVRKLLHDKYKTEYIAAHAEEWHQEYLAQTAREDNAKMRKLELFLEEMKK